MKSLIIYLYNKRLLFFLYEIKKDFKFNKKKKKKILNLKKKKKKKNSINKLQNRINTFPTSAFIIIYVIAGNDRQSVKALVMRKFHDASRHDSIG